MESQGDAEARSSLLQGGQSQNQQSRVYGTTAKDSPDTIDKRILLQDEAIGHLSHGVENIRNIAVQIHDEVDGQVKLLDGIGTSVDDTSQRVVCMTGNAERARGSVYNFRTFCILLWPLVLLIILLVEGIIHFLF